MQPITIYENIFFNSINHYLKRLGLDVLRSGYEAGPRTIFTLFTVLTSAVCFVYTIVAYDSDLRFKSWACISLSFQGLAKITTIYLSGNDFCDRVHFILEIYKSNTCPKCVNYLILQRWSARFRHIFNVGQILVAVSCLAFVFYAIIEAIVTGERVFIGCIMVPGLDEQSIGGYIVLCVYHTILILIMYLGLVSFDMMKFIVVLHIWPMVQIFRNVLDQLNQAVLNERLVHSRLFWRHLRNLIKIHQELMQFLENTSDMFVVENFLEVYLDAGSMCLVAFCIPKVTWPPLYFLQLLFFSKLLVVCMLGTILEMAMDHKLSGLQASKWNLLPANYQSLVMLMILRAQNPQILRAGNIPLNLDSFVRIMKSVYSVLILLQRTVD